MSNKLVLFCAHSPGHRKNKNKTKNHPLLFSSKHTGKLNTSRQIVCSGAEVSDMFQKHQKTWVMKGHMRKCTHNGHRLQNKTSAA